MHFKVAERMSLRRALVCIVIVSLIIGCNSSKADVSKERLKSMAGGDLKPVVPVSGKVLVDGAPVEGIMLELWPTTRSESPIRKVIAGADGKYCWSRYSRCDGLEPGAYKLTFKHLKNPRKETSEDLFKGRFSKPSRSPHELTVKLGKPQENVDYDLSSK